MSDFCSQPLVPADVDLRGLPGFMLRTDRLLSSELVALGTPEECWAAVLLWCRAWQQRPAASLPDDDRILASFSGAGRRWPKIKAMAMRGFIRCSDGRWYHKVLAEEAIDAWERRLRFRERSEKANKAKRAGGLEGGQQGNLEAGQQGVLEGCLVGNEGTVKGQGSDSENQNPSGSAAPIPDCPQQEIIALYAEILPVLAQPRDWPPSRAEKLRERWRYCAKSNGFSPGYKTKEEGLEFWKKYFSYVAERPKLTGRMPPRTPDSAPWKPDLPWLIKQENFLKVIEGKYA